MFVQPDWWEVTAPGVGTNRYAYSFNDPVNLGDHEKPDPGPGDGWSSDKPERERNGWHDDRFDWSGGSDRVMIGDGVYVSYRQYDALVANTRANTTYVSELLPGSFSIGHRKPVTVLYVQNSMMLENPVLTAILADKGFGPFVVDALVRSNDLSKIKRDIVEVAGHIYVGPDGKVKYALFDVHPGAVGKRTTISKPSPAKGWVGVTFHTHPYDGGPPSTGRPPADIDTAIRFGTLGIVATYKGEIWGYGPKGYQ